jgi:hypothetical protein
MNTTIIVVVAFAVGLAFGSAFFGTCNTRAYDYNDSRFGDSSLDREYERSQQEVWRQQQEMRMQDLQRRKPC